MLGTTPSAMIKISVVPSFLEFFRRGEQADMAERPADGKVEQYLRWIVDDLRAFYFT
jgi:hypothetical protein